MQARPSEGHSLSLHQVLPEACFVGSTDIRISGCACDSRQVKAGELFVALRGSRCDGRQFIPKAISRGCSAVLVEPPAPELPVPLPVCVVSNAREAYGRICQSLAGDPSQQLKLIGVTGTNGKTTTSCLIAGVLHAAGYRVGLLGTLGYFDGDTAEDATHTTPPADRLATLLARMVRNGCTHAVMEVSSHALDQCRVAGMTFDAACVTNVSRDHLDYHPTIQDYRLCKSKLFDRLAPEGFAVLNNDDIVASSYLPQVDGPALTVGIHSPAEITATLIERVSSEQMFLLTAGNETMPVCTRMIGTHHIYNCLIAAAVGLAYGLDLPTVVRGLENVKHVPGRLERIECGQPFSVFVDFAHTPVALTACLQTLREVTAGRLLCVFGAGGERDREKRPLMGQAVEQAAHVAVVTSDNPRGEDPHAIIDGILSGFEDPTAAVVIPDRREAIQWALGNARPGDCVLIAGKGHENYQVLAQENIPFDDREIVRQWLYEVRPFAEEEWVVGSGQKDKG
jgi:UDP-N-acetylmuramoyl-L-alanyl-D-glutamate--2,6-diaminopimelate ligase